MRQLFGRKFANCSTKANCKIAVLWLLGGLLAVFFLYWGLIHPILSWAYWGPDCYEGVSYLQDDLYLEFEGGEQFKNLLEQYDLDGIGEITEFSYYDNHRRDNPLFGYMCDVFSVTAKMPSEEAYQEQKAQFVQGNSYSIVFDGRYIYDLEKEDHTPYLLVCDDNALSLEVIFVNAYK